MPRHPSISAQRCQAAIARHAWNVAMDGRCGNKVHILVNKKRLCAKHAALETLHIALANKSARRVYFPPLPPQYGGVTIAEK